jgi:RNA polymerase sigma-70 factor (family 1)
LKDSDKIKQLLIRIAEGDSDAFREFYDMYYLKVYRFSGYFVKSDNLREEIVSDIFFSVWQSRKKLPDVENIEAYLYTATRNKALYYLNNASPGNNVSLDDLPIGFTRDEETPESIIITEELKQELKKAVAELPERCKLIFLMAKEEGLRYKEIAGMLSISEKTVNAQMVIALRKIGETLRRYLYMFLLFSVFISNL